MISDADRSAFVSGASRDLAMATAQVLANEFAHVIILDGPPATGCQTNWAKTDPDKTVLHRDTNGRPLRDWDD